MSSPQVANWRKSRIETPPGPYAQVSALLRLPLLSHGRWRRGGELANEPPTSASCSCGAVLGEPVISHGASRTLSECRWESDSGRVLRTEAQSGVLRRPRATRHASREMETDNEDPTEVVITGPSPVATPTRAVRSSRFPFPLVGAEASSCLIRRLISALRDCERAGHLPVPGDDDWVSESSPAGGQSLAEHCLGSMARHFTGWLRAKTGHFRLRAARSTSRCLPLHPPKWQTGGKR